MKITSCFAKDLFQGKTVFITGGGSGINLGIARNFAAVSANLGIVGRAQEKLDAAVRDLPRRALRQASQRFSNATTCGHRPSSRFIERHPATAASRRSADPGLRSVSPRVRSVSG